MSDATALLVGLALLAGNAFFVGAEFALISARRTQIEPRAATGSRTARTTLKAMESVSLMMAGAQLGITVCSLGLGAVGEPAVAHLLEVPFEALGVPDALLHPLAFAIALSVVVFLHMVVGEMVPKNIALAGPERSALVLGPPLFYLVKVLFPLIWALNWIANHVLRLLKVDPRDEVASSFTTEQVTGLVAASRSEGLLDDAEHELVTGALEFDAREVGSILIGSDQLVTAPEGSSVRQLEDLCARTGYSRFPVADPTGSLTGYVHLKDLLSTPRQSLDEPVRPAALRSLATVTSSDPLRAALRAMQERRAHLARVTDASTGAVLGVIALEDVLEELVGQVRDAMQAAEGEAAAAQ